MKFQRIQALILVAFLTTSAVAFSFTAEETIDTFIRPDPDADIWAELLSGEEVNLDIQGWIPS